MSVVGTFLRIVLSAAEMNWGNRFFCGLHFKTDGKGGRRMPGGDDADGHGEPADMVTRSRDPNAPAPTGDGVLCGAIQVASDREG